MPTMPTMTISLQDLRDAVAKLEEASGHAGDQLVAFERARADRPEVYRTAAIAQAETAVLAAAVALATRMAAEMKAWRFVAPDPDQPERLARELAEMPHHDLKAVLQLCEPPTLDALEQAARWKP